MSVLVGSKIKFAAYKRPYTVQAADERFAICTQPFNLQRTVFYTIIDFKDAVRGAEDLVFSMGAETREDCENMLCRLNGKPDSHDRAPQGSQQEQAPFQSAVSRRNRVALDIESITEPKSRRASSELSTAKSA